MTVRTMTETLPGSPDQVRRVRRAIAAALGDAHPCADDAVLLVSETTTNAVRHSRSGDPGGTFTVRLEWAEKWARVSVCDDGSGALPCWCRARQSSTGGRGTELLDGLAARWGTSRENGATTVWFEVVP